MKRFISVILTCALMCIILSPLGTAAGEPALSAAAFAGRVAALAGQYTGVYGAVKKGAFSAGTHGKSGSEFSLCRLIVSSSRHVPAKGAETVVEGYRNLHVLQYDTPQKAEAAYQYYKTCSYVDWVEADRPIQKCADAPKTAAAQRGTLSWGSQTIGTSEIFRYLENSDVVLQPVLAGVIDSGLDIDHPIFAGRLADKGTNLSASGDDTAMSDDPESHGTHVAGILADNTPDAVKIKGYKVFDKYGNSSELLAAAALDLAVEDGMNVVNISLTADDNRVLADSIENAYDHGVTVVGAMGNEGERVTDILPASSPYAIGVGSVGKTGTASYFSNYGPHMDVLAPGESIYSAVNGGGYDYMTGTSMATPYAAASACWLLAADGTLTPRAVKNRLTTYAVRPADDAQNMQKYGAGTVNIAEAWNAPRIDAPAPGTPAGEYRDACFVSFDISAVQTLYYTTDGSLPTLLSPQYTAPLVLNEDTVLRWFAVDTGKRFRSVSAEARYTVTAYTDEALITVDENGMVTACHSASAIVNIPDSVNGIPVRGIGSHAFAGQRIEEIYLPETASVIDEYAFYQCSGLKKFSAPGLTGIGKFAFAGCINLAQCNVEQVTDVGENAFDNCGVTFYRFNRLKSCKAVFPVGSVVILPQGVSALPEKSLPDCTYYGFAGSYAQTWAEGCCARFVAVDAGTALICDVPVRWAEGDAPLLVVCGGTDLTYQWYGCRTADKKDLIVFDGASAETFDPSRYTPCCYYFCEITSHIGTVPLFTVQSAMSYRFVPADYTALKAVMAEVPSDLSIYTNKSVAALQNALDDVDYDLDAANQEKADASFARVSEAVKQLRRRFFLVLWFRKLVNALRALLQ